MNVYSVQAACKSVFKVGCDCVAKACSEKEGVRTAIETADRKRRNAQAKVARDARDARAKDALATLREENAALLATLPHPRAAETSPGSASNLYFSSMSALDWLDFMLKACGATGRAKLLKEARALLAAQ
jgi:archaellum component FlaD/FlaE